MFWKRKKKASTVSSSSNENLDQSPQVRSMIEVINKQEAANPLIRAQITSKDITNATINMLRDEKGVRIETALGILGALAGAACAYAMLDAVARGQKPEAPEIVIAQLKTGERLMFGDYINRKLVEGEKAGGQVLSLWHLFAGIAQHHMGQAPKIDLEEVFKRVAQQVGTDDFGKVNVPADNMPGDLPQNFVAALFPKYLDVLARYNLPSEQYWLAIGLSAQEIIGMGKDTADITMLTRLTFECAVYASKIDMEQYLNRAG